MNIELLKADYAALLDKLICPSCKNEQTFDENYEKIRECRRCNEKYVKAKTSNSSSFERTNKENEEKRLVRLKCIEDGIYGKIGNFSRFLYLLLCSMPLLSCFHFLCAILLS
jgi:ribosomal protein L37AE/L43A